MTSIPLSSIIEGSRARKDYGDLAGLKDSLQRIGSIHPIVLSKRLCPLSDGSTVPYDDRYDLIAGGRRFRCMKELGTKELFHGSVLEPSRLGFLFKDEVPEDELREAELDENLYRLKPKWQEDVLLVADVHELKRKKLGANKWGQRHTAALLGQGYSLNQVNLALKVAKLLRSGDKEISACETLSDATALRVKRVEDMALAELQKRVMPVAQEAGAPTSPTSTSSFLDSFNLKGGDVSATTSPEPLAHGLKGPVLGGRDVPSVSPSIQPGPLQTKEPVKVPLLQMFFNMDFRQYKGPLEFNHIVTDIPYGIDMENLNKSSKIDDVSAEHEVEANIDLMRPFLEFAWNTVKPHGFCVFFYDLDHHEKLQGWARDIGWKVQRWPLIWIKSHNCQNNAAQYNTTKNFEVAMILRKDEHTVLRPGQHLSTLTCDGSAERKLYQNPFAKPFELWKWIFDAIAFPGQTILDPFCGEMSSCRAAANCGLVPYGIEINEKHYNRGLENMKKVFAVIHKSNVIFT